MRSRRGRTLQRKAKRLARSQMTNWIHWWRRSRSTLIRFWPKCSLHPPIPSNSFSYSIGRRNAMRGKYRAKGWLDALQSGASDAGKGRLSCRLWLKG
jgi:hypothetical protein